MAAIEGVTGCLAGEVFALGGDVIGDLAIKVTDPREGVRSLHYLGILLVLEVKRHVYFIKNTLLAVARDQWLPLTWSLNPGLEQFVLVPKNVINLAYLVLLEMLLANGPRAIKPEEHLGLHPLDVSLLVLRHFRYAPTRSYFLY